MLAASPFSTGPPMPTPVAMLLIFPAIGALSGLLAGLFGIGGGLVIVRRSTRCSRPGSSQWRPTRACTSRSAARWR
jgi:hypothetical protein